MFLTGTQALVRILLDQRDRDRADGINTRRLRLGLSRLAARRRRSGTLARQDICWQTGRIEFLPAVNEDLAATAVLGSQQVETNPEARGRWRVRPLVRQGPGVDRSGDALKHGNAYGSSPHGGVLVVAGDDHGCVSSSMPHQSDVAFMAWFMPTLNPSSVAEYLSFGEYGYALSRFSGMWVGFKAISETVESCASVDLPAARAFSRPTFDIAAGRPALSLAGSARARRSSIGWRPRRTPCWPLPRPIRSTAASTTFPHATYGIVTTGKATST